MSHTFVLLVAMSGLGCQNKPVEPGDLPPVISPAPASPAPEASSASTNLPPYPRYFPDGFPDVEAQYSTPLGRWSSTFWSLILGRDLNVPTQRQIEASVYGHTE